MTKSILLFQLFFLMLHGTVFSQNKATLPTQNSGQKPNLSINSKNIGNASVQNLVTNLKRDTCLDKKFSIVFYLIADTIYPSPTPSISPATQSLMANIITTLNAAFKPICVSFESCSTFVIPNHPYNNWSKNIVDPQVTANWYTENTINLYLPFKVVQGPILHQYHIYSYTYPPSTITAVPNKDVIVVEKGRALIPNNSSKNGAILLHTFGHYFGLPHTFDEINPNLTASPSQTNTSILSKEFVDRSNCYLHGDGFCDTQADPYPVTGGGVLFPFCFYSGGAKDGKGVFYEPPIDNYMSGTDCACRFTQEQYNYMAYFILTKRMYLH
jgi:hypothetical protein